VPLLQLPVRPQTRRAPPCMQTGHQLHWVLPQKAKVETALSVWCCCQGWSDGWARGARILQQVQQLFSGSPLVQCTYPDRSCITAAALLPLLDWSSCPSICRHAAACHHMWIAKLEQVVICRQGGCTCRS
jgi:hypothetical protein